MIRIDAPKIGRHFGPGALPPFGSIRNFTGQYPEHRIGAVARHQIPPVPLQTGRSNRLHAVAVPTPPGANNRRSNPRVHEMLQAPIRVVKIPRIDPVELDGFVWKAALVREPRFEKPFIGIWPAHNLDDGEALRLPVRREFLKAFPGHPLAQILPPRIAKPEERRVVGVREMPLILGHGNRPVLQQGVLPAICNHFNFACDAVESGIRCIAALGPPDVRSELVGCVADSPVVTARPETRHPQLLPIRARHHRVEFNLHERIRVGLRGNEGHLRDTVRLSPRHLGGVKTCCAKSQCGRRKE